MSLAGALSVVAVAATLVCRHAEFPGPKATCRSPDTMHVLRWVEPASDRDHHHLVVGSPQQESETELLAFRRHVEVVWSPSGESLAVTNGWASDASTVLLWRNLATAPVDLLEALAAQEGQRVASLDFHGALLS